MEEVNRDPVGRKQRCKLGFQPTFQYGHEKNILPGFKLVRDVLITQGALCTLQRMVPVFVEREEVEPSSAFFTDLLDMSLSFCKPSTTTATSAEEEAAAEAVAAALGYSLLLSSVVAVTMEDRRREEEEEEEEE
ncbi:unnamed protein product [Linum trigynum]|uniref:Uncharacterized protein n=1 Tax=Linum trigynum TaxID=586398 RepID=A0AAV2EVC3_9ROSI